MEENYALPEENNSTKNTDLLEVDPSKPDTIPKFVDELPIPKVLTPDKRGNGYACYEVEMKCAKHKFHRDFSEALIYGYNGMYPGPTIETMKGQTVYVKWINNLPLKHFLPVDKTLHGAIDNPEVRTVVHLHGANVASDSDGHPEAWYTRNYEYTGRKYSRQVYKYNNDQQATTLWYHDHALGTTRLNVYAGLAGLYIIHDFQEQSLELPKGKYDIPLIIQDKSFNKDGSLFYPENTSPIPQSVNPSVVRAFIGNTMVVNGKVWPYLKVEPRRYRFRILNASNTNGYILKLSNEQSFWQIGTDGGMLGESVSIQKIPIDTAERIDVIIDFSSLKGQTITLKTEEPDLKVDVMQFIVGTSLKGEDKSLIPGKLRPVEKLDESMATKTRRFVITQDTDIYKRVMLTLSHNMFSDPATETPEYDSIEIWEFANPLNIPANVAHPIHLHLVQFQILDRQLFDVDKFDEAKWIEGDNTSYMGDPIPPDPSEGGSIPPDPIEKGQRAWKDTVRVESGKRDVTTGENTGKVTRIIAHFKNFTGEYLWHCHILEHEDHDMMRPLRIIKKYCD